MRTRRLLFALLGSLAISLLCTYFVARLLAARGKNTVVWTYYVASNRAIATG